MGRDDLTEKEREIMDLICAGKTSDEIAMILNRHIGTVKQHIRLCYTKLEAHSKGLAVAKYLDPGRFKKP